MSTRASISLFLTAIALLFTRRPDAFLNPQFWAEDGPLWYGQAYTAGYASLTISAGGYLQTLPRALALACLPLRLEHVPAIFTAVAILTRVLPVHFLMSSRLSADIPSMVVRGMLALVLLAVPNSWEVHANMTQAVRHLAILSALVLLAPSDGRYGWRWFDYAVLLITGTSGPFSIFLMPLLAARLLKARDAHSLICALIVVATASVQGGIIALAAHERPPGDLSASWLALARVFGGQVVIGGTLGQRGWEWIMSRGHLDAWCITAAAIGSVVFAFALLRGPRAARLFATYTLLIFAAGLVRPTEDSNGAAWATALTPGAGGRQWVFPILGLQACLVALARHRSGRWLAVPMLALATLGAVGDWRYPAYVDLAFRHYARQFEMALPGEHVSIPINPPGWELSLVKMPGR